MRSAYYCLPLAAVLGFAAARLVLVPDKVGAQDASPQVQSVTASRDGVWVAGPGRVEPATERVLVGADLNGRLESLSVEEGDSVKKGQALACLANAEYRAAVDFAEAQVSEREAVLRRILGGASPEERAEAAAAVREMEANRKFARAETDRALELLKKGGIPQSEADRYVRESTVAEARHDGAVQRHAQLTAPARNEDRVQAEAALRAAKAQLAEAQIRHERTIIRSPIDGVVLRRHHQVGESVTGSMTAADPIFVLGDLSRLRVRMDLDEADVASVRPGQRAYVTAKAYGKAKFAGRVFRVGSEMGKKNVITEEPAERQDVRVLETLIEFEEARRLPVGLRVDVFIETAPAAGS